jgi:uncharacterized peroxidase-related enzyme
VVNRCVYCVSVHAGRYITLAKQPEVVAAVFDGTEAGLGARDRAIVHYSTRLAMNPPQATAEDVQALRAEGLSDLEILDLTLSVAVFGWANRLMHPLGEAIRPQEV